MKSKCLAVFIVLLFVGTYLIPSTAQNIEKSSLLKDNTKNSKKTEYTGKIYGYTICSDGIWTWLPISNAMVRIGLKITRSDSNGYYEITGLSINRTYIVVANHLGYITTVKKVTLTIERPEKEFNIGMQSLLDFIFNDILELIIKFITQRINVLKS